MNHIILTDGTKINTSSESKNCFVIPLNDKTEYTKLVGILSNDKVKTIKIATEENVIVETINNVQMDYIKLNISIDDKGKEVYSCMLGIKNINDVATKVTTVIDKAAKNAADIAYVALMAGIDY